MYVWDEFSEFLPENRVPTSADFNTYPIRIFNFKVQNKLDKTSFKILFEGWINRILVSIFRKYVVNFVVFSFKHK